MATNDFIGFASSGNANVMSQADYAAAHEQLVGVQPGMASSAMSNKVWRQGANMAAVIGELIKNHGIDALDNGDLATLYNALLLATASTTLAGWMSAADKTKLDGLISTLATQSAAGYMSAEDKTKVDSVILTNATQSAAGYMSAEDKRNLTALLTDGDYESATTDTSHMTGTVEYKRFGRFLIVSVAGKLNADLAIYSNASLASGLPIRDGTPGNNFPTGMIFFDSSTYYGAWLTYAYDGVIYINARDLQVPANLQFYGYIFCPITI
jgi:hypothetical protein